MICGDFVSWFLCMISAQYFSWSPFLYVKSLENFCAVVSKYLIKIQPSSFVRSKWCASSGNFVTKLEYHNKNICSFICLFCIVRSSRSWANSKRQTVLIHNFSCDKVFLVLFDSGWILAFLFGTIFVVVFFV